MRAIALSIAFAWSAQAGGCPVAHARRAVGPGPQRRRERDLKRLPIREVSVADPHSKQASRYCGVALGAFRLVVPTDKRGSRWVRQVVKLRVVEPSRP